MEKTFKIYPIHFDSSLSHSAGRKYATEASVSKPTFKEIKTTLDLLGAKYVAEPEKTHPKDIRRQGRFTVTLDGAKGPLVKSIAEKIKEARTSADKNKNSTNFLNLVPRSKKKSKKH